MQRRVDRITVRGQGVAGPSGLPIIRHRSEFDGPVVAITACLHGDEVIGLAVAHALDARLPSALLRGEVHIVPAVNPGGLATASRTVPSDGADLNRCFPGRPHGGAGERLAHSLWSELERQQITALIDLHSDSTQALPYAIIDRPVSLKGERRRQLEQSLCELADASGLTVLQDYPDGEYRRYRLDRSLAGAVVNHLHLPAVTIEIGPRRALDPGAMHTMLEAVWRMLGHLGLVDAPASAHPTRLDGGPWRRAGSPRCRSTGLFQPVLEPGQPFKQGQALGTLRQVDGSILETLRAEQAGVVISWLDTAWVNAGTVVGTLAVPEV